MLEGGVVLGTNLGCLELNEVNKSRKGSNAQI
jgi:hypothetical protein